jgi:hypothetical protein
MPTPFPGMDPYLDHPELWPSVHLGLIAAIWMDLAPRLSPRYTVSVEERTYIAASSPDSFIGRADVLVASDGGPGPVRPGSNGGVAVREPVAVYVPAPDVVTERYLEVRNVQYGYVVTVIELLSPSNKRPGSEGFREYQTKRETLLSTRTSLVEIDLLRAGQRPAISGPAPDSDYRIVIVRGWERPRANLYAFDLQDPIPVIPIPLERGDDEPLLDLNALLHRLYDQAVYNLRIDYRQPPTPPLDEADAAWTAELTKVTK